MADPKDNNLGVIDKTRDRTVSKAIATILDPSRSDARSSSPTERPAIENEGDSPIEAERTRAKVVEIRKSATADTSDVGRLLLLTSIDASPFQARDAQTDQELESLVNSIREKGLLQPVVVRRTSSSSYDYELVAGERRLRAAKLAGLSVIPAIIKDCSDREAAELGLIENAQRENLDPIEEASAYQVLSERFKLTQKEVGDLVGKSRAAVANSIRLLSLEQEIIDLVKMGELSAGHGRALLAVEDKRLQLRLARRAVKSGLSVRALEEIVAGLGEMPDELSYEEEKQKAQLEKLQTKVRNLLNIETANLSLDTQGRRRLSLTFETEAEWRRFMGRIKE